MNLGTIIMEAAGKTCKKMGGGDPVIGRMVCGTVAGVKFIDKQFAQQDADALKKARERNGGCEHIELAFSSGTFSEGSPGEANKGDRDKTVKVGKRFKYSDMTYCFWHPAVQFLPSGVVSAVYIGESEKIPEQSSGPTMSASPPVTGKATCPFCSKKILEAAKEVEKAMEHSRNKSP